MSEDTNPKNGTWHVPDIALGLALTIYTVEMELLENITYTLGTNCAAATWLSRGLKLEEAQISLQQDIKGMNSRATDLQCLAHTHQADQLATKISHFLAKGSTFLQFHDDDNVLSDISDEESNVRVEDMVDNLGTKQPDQVKLPLPSNLGHDKYMALSTQHLI